MLDLTILDDGKIKVNTKDCLAAKVGRKQEQLQKDSDITLPLTKASIWYPIEIGKRLILGSVSISSVRGVYIHELEGYDDLLYPLLKIYNRLEDLPKTQYMNMPELKKHDLLLETDNSIYYLTASGETGKHAESSPEKDSGC